jgi:hypothetical protein
MEFGLSELVCKNMYSLLGWSRFRKSKCSYLGASLIMQPDDNMLSSSQVITPNVKEKVIIQHGR